jgi:mono/diheme cytochrome c family protein
MIINVLVWIVLAAVTVGFGWLAVRAWRSRNLLARWLGGILSSLVTLILMAASIAAAIGLVKIYTPRGGPVQNIHVQGTPEQIARGEHIASVFCISCHSPNGQLPLIGGLDLAKDIPMPIGSFVSVNLTPGGPLKDYSDGEILRVLREGGSKERQLLLVMSNVNVKYMSDDDLEAVIAFLRSQPAVDHPTPQPPDHPNLLGVIMMGIGLFPQSPPVTGSISAPPKAATVDYGKYILSYQDCRGCHGENLTGGTSALLPKGPSLRVVKGWTQEQFIQTLRTGVDPGGNSLGDLMPWRDVGKMDDVELEAVYLYLTSLN